MPFQMVQLPLAIASSELRSHNRSRLVNMYAEQVEPAGKSSTIIRQRWGMETFAELGSAPIRGFVELDGRLYVVQGTNLHLLDSSGNATLISESIDGQRLIRATTDLRGAAVIGGDRFGYILTGYQGFDPPRVVQSQPNMGPIIHTNGTVIYGVTNSDQFFYTDVGDPYVYNPLSFATAEANPDTLKAFAKLQGLIYFIGANSVETWAATGQADLPFERTTQAIQTVGTISGDSVATSQSAIYFLGSDRRVYRMAGLQMQPIGSPAIADRLGRIPQEELETSVGFMLRFNSLIFYVLRTNSGCFVFCETTGLWTEFETCDKPTWQINSAIEFGGQLYLGSSDTGTVYRASPDCYTDAERPLVRSLVVGPLYIGGERRRIRKLTLDAEVGQGAVDGQGEDPVIMMRYSDDGGYLYGNTHTRSLGRRGEYRSTVEWHRLGQSRNRVFEFSVSDPVPCALYGATLEVESE